MMVLHIELPAEDYAYPANTKQKCCITFILRRSNIVQNVLQMFFVYWICRGHAWK